MQRLLQIRATTAKVGVVVLYLQVHMLRMHTFQASFTLTLPRCPVRQDVELPQGSEVVLLNLRDNQAVMGAVLE